MIYEPGTKYHSNGKGRKSYRPFGMQAPGLGSDEKLEAAFARAKGVNVTEETKFPTLSDKQTALDIDLRDRVPTETEHIGASALVGANSQ